MAAPRVAPKSAVGDERHAAAEARAHDGGCRIEHFTHARTALGAFVTDHDDVAGLDAAAVDGLKRILLAVEDAGRLPYARAFRVPRPNA